MHIAENRARYSRRYLPNGKGHFTPYQFCHFFDNLFMASSCERALPSLIAASPASIFVRTKGGSLLLRYPRYPAIPYIRVSSFALVIFIAEPPAYLVIL